MRKFIERAIEKLSKLDQAQIRSLILDLAGANERNELVLDSMSDGVMVSDTQHALVLVNKAADRLIPFTQHEVLERPIWEVIADREISAFVHRSLLSQDSVHDREFTIDSGGTTRILSCSILPLVGSGSIQGNIFHIEDVTEKRGREARLRRAESLASLTTLAAGVAHEIKNPLGSIGIHIQLMQKALHLDGEVDRSRLESYIEVVNEEIDRLNRIVVDFLFAVRPIDVHLEERDLNEIIRDLLKFVRYELEEANIELVEKLDAALDPIALDEKYLKQALMNMVKNAIAAMPDGGTLRIETGRRGDEVNLLISDTGVGISDDILSKIFEPYFTTKDFGSGIGLTLVYKVVKEHMGEITVDSQEGKGATFSITFPIPQTRQHLLSWNGAQI
jgi:two-component system, sporulation sensor kinase E